MFNIAFKTENWKAVKEAAELLALPPALRRRLLSRVGRLVIAQAKKNVKEQKTIDGSPMKPRKRMPSPQRRVYHKDKSVTYKKTNRLMLSDMVKGKWLGMQLPSDDEALVHFFGGAGRVAYKHQHGGKAAGVMRDAVIFPHNIDASKIDSTKKRQTLPSGKTGCSARKAIMLMRLGFMPFRSGFVPDQDWIMSNISAFAAAKIIRANINKIKPGQVPDKTPARPFLGVMAGQMREFREYVLAMLNEKFRAKNYQAFR